MNSIFFVVLIAAFFYAANSQQKSVETKLPDKFFECYNDSAIVINENKLPHNMHALIAMIRKIEEDPLFQTDLRRLSVAILHRFRQDGILINPDVKPETEGIIPYVVKGNEKFKCAKILEMIPTAESFPNNSLTLIQRCSMHSMLSTNFMLHERGDEVNTCRTPRNDEYRYARSVRGHRDADDHEKLDTGVENLSPGEIETMNENEDGVDPNSFYPPLSPNHPESAKLIRGEMKVSLCPQAGGVISTEWGNIAGGALIAGIAAGAQPQNVRVSDLMRKDWFERSSASSETVSNKFMATLAGDLAEVVLIQFTTSDNSENYEIGVEGHWNSSISPKYYFIESNENLEFIAAEVRGGLDGLILANEVSNFYQQMPSLRLSQVLDMYYSDRGLFNGNSIRACNRRAFLPAVAPNDTLFMQTWRAVEALYPDVTTSTMTEEARKKLASKATGDLLNHIPSRMNNDKSCVDTKIINRLAADLTIFIDTNWPWSLIQPILTVLLESSEINKFASNFTLIDAGGSIMINSSDSILDFYALNETHYSAHKNKFDLAKTVDTIQALEKAKLDREKTGGARSSIVLIIPYRADTLDESDKRYYLDRLGKMNEELPDTVVLFLAGGSKDRWADLVRNAASDVFSVGTGSIKEATVPIANLVNRMKKVPRRLLNSQCGSSWSGSGDSASYTDYLEPRGVNLYRLHANYFYSENQENIPAVKVQGFSGNAITVCSSRFPIDVNTITEQNECSQVTTDIHRITISCGDAGFIHACNPLYVAISAASTNSSLLCSEPERCRFPDMVKYTISYENLLCTSGAGLLNFSRILLLSVGFSSIYLKF